MKAFNVGQTVKLKKDSILYTLFPDEVFNIAECRESQGVWSYDLVDDEGAMHLTAREDELELVLPDIINAGVAAGVGWSASSVDSSGVSNFMTTAIDLASSIPDVIGSSVSDAVSTTGDTICAVGESISDVASGCVEAASSIVESVGDL